MLGSSKRDEGRIPISIRTFGHCIKKSQSQYPPRTSILGRTGTSTLGGKGTDDLHSVSPTSATFAASSCWGWKSCKILANFILIQYYTGLNTWSSRPVSHSVHSIANPGDRLRESANTLRLPRIKTQRGTTSHWPHPDILEAFELFQHVGAFRSTPVLWMSKLYAMDL
jgi:hypothetical protein